jgi:hypothetical protein
MSLAETLKASARYSIENNDIAAINKKISKIAFIKPERCTYRVGLLIMD